MRLAILIQTLRGGGAERIASNLSLYLPEETERFIIVYENKVDYEFKGKLLVLNTPSRTNLFIKIKNYILAIYRLKKIKKKFKIGATISFSEDPNVVNILSKISDKAIISVRTYESCFQSSEGLYGLFCRCVMKLLYHRADAIIANSKGVKYDLIKNFGIEKNKVVVIYNLCDIDLICKLAKEDLNEGYKYLFRENKVIISVGRLTQDKGYGHLIRAFSAVKKEISKVKLVILGDGRLQDYLIKLSERLGCKVYSVWDNAAIGPDFDIYFLGFQNNPFRFVARSKLFVLPSFWEGFPNVLIEAMACGTPVISSDCRAGPREIIAPDTEFMYETETPEFAKYGILMPVFQQKFYTALEPLTATETVWAKILIKLLENEDLIRQYREQGRIRANNFSVDNLIKEWIKVL